MIQAARKAVVREVNTQKIIEMHEGGCKKHAIVGTFRDNGIEVTPEYVEAVITVEAGKFATKFLPNKAAKGAIAAAQNTNEPLTTEGIVLA